MKLKKLMFSTVLAIFLLSCSLNKFTIGMSESEFLKHNKAKLVQATPEQTVYRKTRYPVGASPETRFYYFFKGKLVAVDGGERAPDLIIEHR